MSHNDEQVIEAMRRFRPVSFTINQSNIVGIYETVSAAQDAYFAAIQFDGVDAISTGKRTTVFLPF